MRNVTYNLRNWRPIVWAGLGAALILAAVVGVLLGCRGPTETPTISPVETPTSPPSPLMVPAPLEAEAIEPVTTSYIMSWQDAEGVTSAYRLWDIWLQISDTVDSWALYSYQVDWRIVQDGRIVAMGVATNPDLGPAEEIGTGEYNGPIEIEIPTQLFSGTGELWLRPCWYPDAAGWPDLCSTVMFTDTGPPDAEGYLFGQYVEGLPRALYLPYVVKQFCPPCP